MIRNIEFTILKPNEIDKAEDFNLEFSAVAYYYFLKLRKIKIASCSYIKIRLINEKRITSISYTLAEGILFISQSFDFTYYLGLSHIQRLKFQYEVMFNIFKNAFINYKVNWEILNDINNELAANNWQMRYEFVRKKMAKGKEFELIIYMDIDAFIFVGEVLKNGEKKIIPIFKSIPTFFAVEYLFKGYRFFDNNVRIGSKEKAVFEINFESETVTIVDNNKILNKLKYKVQ